MKYKPFQMQKDNKSFTRLLFFILIFILILVSLIFLLIYSNLSEQSIERASLNEQENLTNISYSATIMEDSALSLLTQLYNDSSIQQLVYTDVPNNSKTINAMYLFRNYTSASLLIDSAYIYNINENRVIYTYLKSNSYHLAFRYTEDFFDSEFLEQLCNSKKHLEMPAMRTITTSDSQAPKKVFTYYLPVQSRANAYDGFIVVNIHADRLMELCHGIAGNSSRQIIIADTSENYFVNNTELLGDANTMKLFEKILESGTDTGQCIIDGINESVFCTWNTLSDFPFTFISCIPMNSILQQLAQMRFWLIFFYCAVLIVSFSAVLLFSYKTNREYTDLQKRYTLAEKQYQKNHSFLKDTLLRSFLAAKENFSVITDRFLENKIELENFKHYSLILMEIAPISTTGVPPRVALLSVLSIIIPNKFRFELADVLQKRHLLILECEDASELFELSERVASALSKKYGYSVSGLFSADITSLDEIPPRYQHLAQQFDLRYFYPTESFVDITILDQREIMGYSTIDKVCSSLIKKLKTRNYDQATTLLTSFFDSWFEPFADTRRTVDHLTKELFAYINTFELDYAVTMDFNIATLQNNISSCNYACEVKELFLNLIEDIQSVMSGANQRSKYIDTVIHIIHENYQDPDLTINVLADKVGLSAAHMQSVFKSTTGISIARYLRHFRLEKATALLIDTDIPISDIAIQVGFENSSYFYTVFKKHYSSTPTEFRTQYKIQSNNSVPS